jgi:glycosyltransferase involved in cell wall biosynthesis
MGGSEALARRIAGALNAKPVYACSLYAMDHGGALSEVLEKDGITYHIFDRRGRLDPKLIVRLALRMRHDRIRLVHTHHLNQLVYAGVAGRLVGAKVVHTEHEVYSLSRPRARKVLRTLATLANDVTGVSEAVTDFLRDAVRIPREKLSTVANGVDTERFERAAPLHRSTFGLTDGDIVVGCLARLEPEKGHSTLLDAFARVRASCRSVSLLLIGDGGERSLLMRQAEELGLNGSVRFLGARADVPELLSSCDIVALPSRREGLPMAILEAMAAGKPVVATAVGSVPSVVQDGHTGLLVRPNDVEALATALERLINDREQCRRLGNAARELIRAQYSFSETLAHYETLYGRALDAPSRRS